MKYNLQFFADGEEAPSTDELFDRIGAEEPVPAEQEETVNEEPVIDNIEVDDVVFKQSKKRFII